MRAGRLTFKEQGTGSGDQIAMNTAKCRERQKASRALGLAAVAGLLLVTGCRQDMHNEPKMIPQRGSSMFADHRGARPQVLDTVARGEFHEDTYFYTGVAEGPNGYKQELDLMPFPVTMTVLKRGQERYNVYCTPCHSRVGNGLGEIVMRGYKPAANFHDQVRRAQPVSHYFYVMTHGYGAMPDYSAQLTPADRWSIAAYIRALQLSQEATAKDVPAGTQVQNLSTIAASEGHPEYAKPWALPVTAVWGVNTSPQEGSPAMAPAAQALKPISIPKTNLPAPAAQKQK